ncbi:MAG: response regulator [Candidatus Riflebacteria bacterium]|nr:response regulator [Candidatus Riflebacteria bacterium]
MSEFAEMQKILVVDDKPENVISLSKILEGLSCCIVPAYSGNEALKKVLESDFALAIIDVQMPEMDGFELAGYLFGEKEERVFPIIFLSAYHHDELSVFKGYETGAVDFISKPFNPEILKSKVQVFLKLDAQKREILMTKKELQKSMQELQEKNLLLQKEVSERILAEKQLDEARKEAIAANEAKSRFLAVMSHEIRTPLNAIIGFSELMTSSSEVSEEVRKNSEIILSRGVHLLELINEILDLSKIEAGKVELEMSDFSIRTVVNDVINTFSIKSRKADVIIVSSIKSEVPDLLRGDSRRLKQILTNLVGNSFKFTSHGKIAVAISMQSGNSSNIGLEFRVSDTGTGILPEDLFKLFNPFVQGNSKAKDQGTGLGLVITKNLVEMMGGKIIVESEVGSGTEFIFTAFFEKASEKIQKNHEGNVMETRVEYNKQERRQNAFYDHQKKLNVLIVEDDNNCRLLSRIMLQKMGHNVSEAASGTLAIEMARSSSYDVILMDIQMSEIDGYATTRLLRELDISKGLSTPVIAVTGCVTPEDREKCFAVGMKGFVPKPLEFSLLRDTISSVLTDTQP